MERIKKAPDPKDLVIEYLRSCGEPLDGQRVANIVSRQTRIPAYVIKATIQTLLETNDSRLGNNKGKIFYVVPPEAVEKPDSEV